MEDNINKIINDENGNENNEALTLENNVSQPEENENKTLSDNLNVSASDNSAISEDILKTYELSREELFQLNGNKLFNIFPHHFDIRLSASQQAAMHTSKQWDEYLDELKCAVCGVPGGKCDCNIEGDIMAYQKLTWT